MKLSEKQMTWVKYITITFIALLIITIISLIEWGIFRFFALVLYFRILAWIVTLAWHYFLVRYIILIIIFPGKNFITNRIVSMRLGISSAQNFSTQIAELKRVMNDFKSSTKNNPLSILDFDSRLFVISNAMDSIVSYLRISNSISEKYKQSSYQKALSLNLSMLKLTIEESKLINLIHATMRALEKGDKIELRNATLDSYLKKVIGNLEKVEELLNDFLMKGGLFSAIKNAMFNDTFGSLPQFKIELKNRFSCEEAKITTKDKIVLDALLIKSNVVNTLNISSSSNNSDGAVGKSKANSKSNSRVNSKPNSRENSIVNVSNSKDMTNIMLNSNNAEKILSLNSNANTSMSADTSSKPSIDKNVMIICGPNAASYEIFAYSDKWVEYYLDNGINVFLWNYRGFGESQGSLTFGNMKSDVECVADFLKKYYKFTKIGVHGISIGGVPACHLAGLELVNLCFADRTFSSIDNVCKGFKGGKYLQYIYKLFFFQSSENSKAVKIVASDPCDTMIEELASLKSGISKEIVKQLKNNLEETNSEYIQQNQNNNCHEILKILFDEKDYESFDNSLIYVIKKITNYSYDTTAMSPRTANIVRKEGDIKYEKLDELGSTVIGGNNNHEIMWTTEDSKNMDEQKTILNLKNFFEKFDAAGETLFSLAKCSSLIKKTLFMNNFFSNFLVWGSYKIGNTYASDKIIIYRAVSKKLLLLNQKLSKITNDPAKYPISDPKLLDNLKTLLQCFIKIESFYNSIIFLNHNTNGHLQALNNVDSNRGLNSDMSQRSSIDIDNSIDNKFNSVNGSVLEKKDPSMSLAEMSMSVTTETINNMDSYRSSQLSPFIQNLHIGNLLPLNCGHNGMYNQREIDMYSLYLLNSKFIQ